MKRAGQRFFDAVVCINCKTGSFAVQNSSQLNAQVQIATRFLQLCITQIKEAAFGTASFI